MAMQIELEDPATGAKITYHRITAMTIDLISQICVVVVRGYVSEATRRAGRTHLSIDQVQVNGAPPDSANALAWAYMQLSAVPAGPSDQAGPEIVVSGSTAQASRWAGAVAV